MRFKVSQRVAFGGAIALLTVGLSAPNAYAAAEDGSDGRSSERRNDASERADASQPDEDETSADAANDEDEAPLDEPQPASNADFSGSGANDHGEYDSTRDGSASANGSGDGAAVGEPCAACVGSADNKNPQGQMPDASDANNGYECDGNRGIAQTNPAHTGCVSASSVPTPPSVFLVTTPPPAVLGETLTRPPVATGTPASTPLPVVAPAIVGRAPNAAATLAATGLGSVFGLLAGLGFVLIAVGALARRTGARVIH